MLSFFKRAKQENTESVIDSNELFENEELTVTDVEVKPELSFHPDWQISIEERYYYQFLNNEQAPLKENQISLSGVDLQRTEQGYAVTALVRSSLTKAVRFQETPLLLIGPNGEMLGRKVFDLSLLGELPPKSSRPWKFLFEKHTLTTDELPATGWKLAFELKKAPKPHSLDLAESWEKSLADEDKEKLVSLVQSIQPPKPGEINFMGLQIQLGANGDLHVTLLIRNGSDQQIQLQQLPLQVEDAAGDVVARGAFALDSFNVKPNTSKPWTFIFPKSLVLKEDPDLSNWRAYVPQAE